MRNPDYYVFDGNGCTNFVSQVWNAGGVVYRYYSSPYWYGRVSHGGYTTSWSVAATFGTYMVSYYKLASYRTANQAENYNPAAQGDAILYDNAWGRWGHASIEIYWSGSYTYLGKTYAGDYINQHDKDREHSPWNLGYRMERDPDRRSRYRAVVVHFNG